MASSIEDRSGSGEGPDPINELFTLLAEVEVSVPSRADVERWKEEPLPGVEHCALLLLDGLEDLHRLAAGDLSPQEHRFPDLPRRRAAVALRSLAEHALLLGHLLVPVAPALTSVVADREGIGRAFVLGHPFPNTVAGLLDLASTVAIQGLWAMVAGKPQEPQDPPRDIWVALETALRKLCRCRSNPITRLAHEAIALKWARNWLQDWVGLDRGVWSPLRQRVAAEIDLVRADDGIRASTQLPAPPAQPSPASPVAVPSAPSGTAGRTAHAKRTGKLNLQSLRFLRALPAETLKEAALRAKVPFSTVRNLSPVLQNEGLMQQSPTGWERTAKADEQLADDSRK